MIEQIGQICGISTSDMDAVYAFGSRVYGTYNGKSDYDFIVVSAVARDGETISRGKLNLHLYTPDKFQENLSRHKVVPIECYFAPVIHRLVDRKNFNIKLDLKKLRSEFSEKSSNSWVKGKKKLEVEHDFYIGKKSIFHSIRILIFGIQLANHGKIVDFSEANGFYTDIVNSNETEWAFFKEKYQPVYNNLASEFRKVAPK